ncbi:MAG: integral rane sensor signal transduction histidine kinase [Herminiimonas sp.]|nr:integral rane sensor signal transduction histidine kinase [Herminiimonas sp.]
MLNSSARFLTCFFPAVWILIIFCGPLHAQELVAERAIFRDPTGEMTFEQVQEKPFFQAEKVFGEGFTRSAIWLRVTVDSGKDDRPLVLRVLPATFDEVRLFSPVHDGTAPPPGTTSGKLLSEATELLDGQAGRRVYYLRIKTSGSMLVSTTVETREQFYRETLFRAMVLGAVLAGSVLVILAAIVLVVRRREFLYVLFLNNFVVSVLVFFGWFGYLKEFFGVGSAIGSAGTFSFLVMANIFTGFLFFREVLERFDLPQSGRRIFTVLFMLYIPVFSVFFLGDRQTALSLATLWGLLANIFFLPLTVYLFYRKKLVAWYIPPLILLAVFLLTRTFLIMRGTIAPDASMMSMMAFRLFAFSSFFFIVMLLLDRDKDSRLQKSLLKEAIARSRADLEKQRRIMQQGLMTMLMHELKTPLAIIQLAATTLGRRLPQDTGDAVRVRNINRSVDDLNALVERCLQADQIEYGETLIKKTVFSANELVRELVETMGPTRTVVLEDAEFTVCCDHHYMRLILQNLLSNALKYSLTGSMVTLALQSTRISGGDAVMLSVSNVAGPIGLPEPDRIFSRYYRSEGARAQVGAGLGLWLAQELARQLDSEVRFEVVNQQAVFSFALGLA